MVYGSTVPCQDIWCGERECGGEFLYGRNKTKTKNLTARTSRIMGYKKMKNGKSISGVKLTGNCCVEIFERRRYRGRSQKLVVGYDGPADFHTIRSMKFGVCSEGHLFST